MSGSIHLRPVQEPVLVLPRGSSSGSSLRELNSAWESVDRAKHALERAEARLNEAEGPYGTLTAMDSTIMNDSRSETRVPVDRVPKWQLHSPPPIQNTIADKYNGRNKNKRVTIQEESPSRDWRKIGLSNGTYRSPLTSPSGTRSPIGERSFLQQNNSGSANQSFTTVRTPTKMLYLNEPVPPHTVGYTSTYEKLYGSRKNDLKKSREIQNGSINAEFNSLDKLRSRIQEQKEEFLNGSRTNDFNNPRHHHHEVDPVLTSDNYGYDWPKESSSRLTVRKVAAAPPPPSYKGFSAAESRYALPDGSIVSGRQRSTKSNGPDRKRTTKLNKTTGTNNKADIESHRNVVEIGTYGRPSTGSMVRKRAHGDPKKSSRKPVRKVHHLKGDIKVSKPEKHGSVSVNAWRDSHKTAIKVLGPAPKLRKVSTAHSATDSKHKHSEFEHDTEKNDIEDADISDHPIESDDDKDTATHLPTDAKDVLKDLHLESDEEEMTKLNDGTRDQTTFHTSQPTKKSRKSRKSKTSQSKKSTDPYDVPKIRSYDTSEVRQYMAKQKAERKKREKEEKEKKNLAEKKKQEQLDAIDRKRLESFKTKPTGGRVLQPRLDQTYLTETKPSHTQIVTEMSGSDKENKNAWSPSSSSDTQHSFPGVTSRRLDLLGIITNDLPKQQTSLFTTATATATTISRPTSLTVSTQANPSSNYHVSTNVALYPHNERGKAPSHSMRIESLKATAAALQGRLEKETRRFTSHFDNSDANTANPAVNVPTSRWAYPTSTSSYAAEPSLTLNVDSRPGYTSYGALPTQDWRSKTNPSTASRRLEFKDDASRKAGYTDWQIPSNSPYKASIFESEDKSQFNRPDNNDLRTRHEQIVGETYRSEFSGNLPGMSNLKVGAKKAEQFSIETDAATRIQAVYRGHSVRQKLNSWLSDKNSEDFNVEDIGLDDDEPPSEYKDLPHSNNLQYSGKKKEKTPKTSAHKEYQSWQSRYSRYDQQDPKKSDLYKKSPSYSQSHAYTSRPHTLGHSALNISDDGHSVIDIYTRRLKSLTQDSSEQYSTRLSRKSPKHEDDFRWLPSKSPVYEDDFTSESLSQGSISEKKENVGSRGSPMSKESRLQTSPPGGSTTSQISDVLGSSHSVGPSLEKPVSNSTYSSPIQSSGLKKALSGNHSDEEYRGSPRSSKGSPSSTLSRTSSPHSSAGSFSKLSDHYIDRSAMERPQPRGQAAIDNHLTSGQSSKSVDQVYQPKSLSSAASRAKSDQVQSLLIGGGSARDTAQPVIDQSSPIGYQSRGHDSRPREHEFDRRYPSAFLPSQRYFSPSALEIKMAAELNRLDTVEESYRQLTELEKTRAVSLAQQESVSIAQILKTRQQGHERELQILSSKARQEVDDAHRQLQQLKQQARDATLTAEKTLAQTKKDATDSKVLESQAEVAKATAEAAKQLAQAQQSTLDQNTQRRDYDMGQMATQTASAAAAAAVTAAMEQQRTQQEMWLNQIKSTFRESKPVSSSTSESSKHKASSDYSEDFTGKDIHKSRDSTTSPSPSKTSASISSISSHLGSTASDTAKSNSSDAISEDLPTVKSATSSIATESGVNAHVSGESKTIAEEVPESYSEDFDQTISEVDMLEEDHSDNSIEEVTPIKSEKEVAASGEKRKSPTTTKQSPDRESLNKLSSKLLSQQLKDEELRSQQQLDLLRLREKAIKEKTRAEMAWLEHQRKKHVENQNEEGVTAVKKKQRSLSARLQTELMEIKRLQKAQELAQKDRQLLIYQQQEILRIRQSTKEFKGRMGDISISSMSEMSSNDGLALDEDPSNLTIDSSVGLDSTRLSSPGGENEDREMAAHKQAKVLQKLKLMQAPLNSRHLMKRQQKLNRRRKTAEELLAWKQKLDEEEAKVVRIEKQALNLLEDGETKKEKTPPKPRLTRSISHESDTTIGEMVEEEKAGETSIAEEISMASSIAEEGMTDHGTSKHSSIPSEIDDVLSRSSMADYSQDQFDTADTSITPKSTSTRKGVIKSPIGSLMSLESLRSPMAPWKRRESESGSESERSFSQTMSETASDQSDVEGRLRALNDQLKRRKSEAERLRKQQKRKYREKLKVQEASLRKQLEAYEKFIEKTKRELNADAELAKGAVKPQIKQPGQGKDRTVPGLTRQRTKSESSITLDTTPTRQARESESSHSSLDEDHSPNPSATPSSTASYRGFGLTFTPSPKHDDLIIKTEESPSSRQDNKANEKVTDLLKTETKTVKDNTFNEEDGEEIEENISEAISSQGSYAVVISTGGVKENMPIQKSPAREDSIKDDNLSENEGQNSNNSAVSELHRILSANSSKGVVSYKSHYSEEFESESKAAATEEDISEHLSFSSDVADEEPEVPTEIIVSPKDDQPKVLNTEASDQPKTSPRRQLSGSESEISIAEELQSAASEHTVTEDQPQNKVTTPLVDVPTPKPQTDSGILEEAELSRTDTSESNSRLDSLQENIEDENSMAEEFSGPITDDAALDMIIRSAASAVESFNFEDDDEKSSDDIFSPKNKEVFKLDDTPRNIEDIPKDEVGLVTVGMEAVVEKITDNFTRSLVDISKDRIADVLKYEDDEHEIPDVDEFSEAKEEFDREIEIEFEKTADKKSETMMQNIVGDAIGMMIAIRKKRDSKIVEQSIALHSERKDDIDEDIEGAKVIDVSVGEFLEKDFNNQRTIQTNNDEFEKVKSDIPEEIHTEKKEPTNDNDAINSIYSLPPLSPTKSLTSDPKDVDHDVFAPPDSPKIDDSRSSSPDISDRMEQMQLLDQHLMDKDIFGEQEWFDDDFSSMPKTKSLVEVPKRNKDDQKKQETSSTIELSKLKEIQKITEELFFAVPHNKEDVSTIVSKSVNELIHKKALEESLDDVVPSASILGDDTKDSDIESVSKKSYKTLLFDLSNEVYKDVLSEQMSVTHPPWIKQKRRPRKYNVGKGSNQNEELNDMINGHVKLLLGLEKKKKTDGFSLKYSKKKKDHVDEILIQELREEEPEWVNYDDDEVTVKMQLADGIMESLLTETAMVLTHINDKRKLREQNS
ncbi:centrosome-associated protein 350-like isoform X2 [Antedon mediterranea]|uniref:centrosome-associated protein 350-like isoform X2 n=1 Tax=Antedon mediterranea TaxID=105859 RepID=UPI003AF8231E